MLPHPSHTRVLQIRSFCFTYKEILLRRILLWLPLAFWSGWMIMCTTCNRCIISLKILLIHHPRVEISFVNVRKMKGKTDLGRVWNNVRDQRIYRKEFSLKVLTDLPPLHFAFWFFFFTQCNRQQKTFCHLIAIKQAIIELVTSGILYFLLLLYLQLTSTFYHLGFVYPNF